MKFKLSLSQEREVTRRYLDGERVTFIAQAFGIVGRTVQEVVKRQGIKPSARRGAASHKFRLGRYVDRDGYVRCLVDEHPNAYRGRYVFEHRLMMEKALRRRLRPEEIVHHRNGNRVDNRLQNLELTDRADHMRQHDNLHRGGV